ncbi:MAG: hypothetical protein WC178_03540 [Candidatus Paceibacterota bacterium]|jgi:hypothetical protein
MKLKKALAFLGLGLTYGTLVGLGLGVSSLCGWIFTLVFWTVIIYLALGAGLN